MTVNINQFFQIFFDEAEELLAEMERLLLAIDADAPQIDELHAVFRTAHSIKGGAATFGLTDLSEVTHVLESLLDRLRNGDLRLTREHVDGFLATKDVLKMLLDGHRHGAAVDQNAVADIRMVLQAMLPDAAGRISGDGLAPPKRMTGEGVHPRNAFRVGLEGLSEKDLKALEAELALLGEVQRVNAAGTLTEFVLHCAESRDDVMAICSFIADPEKMSVQPLSQDEASASDARRLQEEAQGYGFFDGFITHADAAGTNVDSVQPLQAAPADAPNALHDEAVSTASMSGGLPHKESATRQTERPAHANESSSIRVGIEKVDQLINLVGELVITQAMIEQRTGALDPIRHERLLHSVNQLTRNTRDLQEAVMSIRMMPMDYVFSRFPRMVRDLATKLGKKVDFITHGAATELDKGLIERIVDPLTHLVRNSIDHGIEIPAVRLQAGKSEAGRLSLSAAHQGGNIVIEVSDDGAGLNRSRILDKAKERGLAVSESMADSDVWQLIFAPGFSTAEHVTDVSGRGVGMDVVKRNIEAMGGIVDIRTSTGFGTTISISLPLTLAILDGMSIMVGDEIYILPLAYVVESLQPALENVKEISGKGRVIKVRGEYLPLVALHQTFGIVPRFTSASEGIVVILESDGRKIAMLVDELVGQQQVVVKNLESNYRKIPGISGATILGDGGVSLIIDVAAMLRSSSKLADEPIFAV